jgi:aerobic carbon-monoxide dehydrogenase medium subunit
MEFRSAASIDEAVELLADLGSDAQVVAGGTDLMVQHLREEIDPAVVVHVGVISELAGVAADGDLHIGAGTTHRLIGRHREVRRLAPALAQASATVGGWQTQTVATLGGNVCNASPAADTIAPLLIADAVVELSSTAGVRSLPLDEFVTGRRATARRPDELVTGFRVSPLPPRTGETYVKVAPRRAMEVAVVGLAVRLTMAEDGETVADVRIAACAVAPRPFRATAAEHSLIGGRLDPDRVGQAGALLVEQAAPIDDHRATARYRRRILSPLLERALHTCRQTAVGGSR